ncbi:DUF350 domain-containing protein [uncultured Pseudoteredinibacter sp.]|uniref:DUF350 domain-containing protein n=1 Tax=uncultured Pseudoteredinibacter sp. TaxID=1641701 RepID=UPI002607B396|nr:DUF350 domain-containing protein [uncultured Pseudoteredinibacter sp.]
MDAIIESLNGFSSFLVYFGFSIGLFLVFKILYTLITPHDEWQLLKEQRNTSAALGLGGALIGFAIALAGAASNSVSILDYAIWAIIALVAQLIAFALVRFVLMPKLVERIENDEISAGIILASMSIAVGLINAACMSY